MALRFGLSFPMGDATSAPLDSLGARYAWQVPIALDVGAKIGPSVFVGGYLLFAFGAEGSDALVESLCDDDDDDLENDVNCNTSTLRLGLKAQYHFMPGEKTNVWVGYGAGFESSTQSIRDSQQGYAEATTVSGITWAELSVGADFRSKLFGVGPYAELALGRFDHSRTEMNSVETAAGDIADPAWHAWFSLGLRMILFP
jgi:hypothetical protein